MYQRRMLLRIPGKGLSITCFVGYSFGKFVSVALTILSVVYIAAACG